MKKLMFLLAALLLLATTALAAPADSLAPQAGEDFIVGEWRLISFTAEGEQVDLDEVREDHEPFVIKEDGTFAAGVGDGSARGMWKASGREYRLVLGWEAAVPALLSEDGTRLTIRNDEAGIVVEFEKRAA